MPFPTPLTVIPCLWKLTTETVLVCGLPVNFDGTPSVQTQRAQYFIDRLAETLSVKIVCMDERCSTIEAEEVLIEQGKSRQERKSCVDALAAATILQAHLNDINKNK